MPPPPPLRAPWPVRRLALISLSLFLCCFCRSSLGAHAHAGEGAYDGAGDGGRSGRSGFGSDGDDEHDDFERELDCGMRRLFLEAARRAVPWRTDLADVHDALELEDRCGHRSSPVTTVSTLGGLDGIERIEREGRNADADEGDDDALPCGEDGPPWTYHVHPTKGNDDDDNSIGDAARPFSTLHRALEASRAAASAAAAAAANADADAPNGWNPNRCTRRTIVLHGGIHYLNETIVLTPADSNLTIRGWSASQMAWISGGIFIDSTTAGWKPAPPDALPNKMRGKIWVANLTSILSGRDNIPAHNNGILTGLFTVTPHRRMTLARYPNADVERWDAPDRYVSSRVVNDRGEWLFPPYGDPPEMFTVDLTDPNNPTGATKDDSNMREYNMFGTGRGGVCATVWGDKPSYWCGNVSAGGWAEVDRAAALSGRLNIPRGMVLRDDVNNGGGGDNDDDDGLAARIAGWGERARGAIVHVAHTQGWAWHMFNVSSVDSTSSSSSSSNGENDDGAPATTTTVHFDAGGWQGGRNWQCRDSDGHLSSCDGDDKRLSGGDWYVEGVLDELDSPGEFYYDRETGLLYFYPPDDDDGTGSSSDDNKEREEVNVRLYGSRRRRAQANDDNSGSVVPDLIATNLQTLIKIEGTMDNPVRNVELLGVGFRDAAKTYMEPWSAPSGGDWALHRGGAVHVEGAENVTVSDCTFRRVDGNAIMLSGYTRHVRVSRSEFAWIGNGAVATWGDTKDDGYDATGGTQPRFSVLERNVVSNLGLYQKQSSGWGQNKACQNIIRNNVMWNLPRAAINFNDGLGGGNLVEGNVIFNSCRESGDHGPINSWERMPFLSDTAASSSLGAPSFRPLPTHTSRNLILANYGASQGFDNDDGSSWYHTHDNVFYSADGFKMDYGGHDSAFSRNLVYGRECFGTGSFLKGHADRFDNNTCILTGRRNEPNAVVGHMYQCSVDGLRLLNNSYFTPNGTAIWECGAGRFTLNEMQRKGMEAGSTVGKTPDAATILSWARDILKMCGYDSVSAIAEA